MHGRSAKGTYDEVSWRAACCSGRQQEGRRRGEERGEDDDEEEKNDEEGAAGAHVRNGGAAVVGVRVGVEARGGRSRKQCGVVPHFFHAFMIVTVTSCLLQQRFHASALCPSMCVCVGHFGFRQQTAWR